MRVQYAIDNFLFETESRKIYVTSSKGILDNPEPKEPFKADYPFRHGEEVFWSPNEVMYKARNISLECFLTASSNSDLITQFNALCAIFRGQMGKKLRRLYIQVGDVAPLFYDVYLSGKIDLEKKWSQGNLVGKFTINLVEPYPTKVSYHLSDFNYIIGNRNIMTTPQTLSFFSNKSSYGGNTGTVYSNAATQDIPTGLDYKRCTVGRAVLSNSGTRIMGSYNFSKIGVHTFSVWLYASSDFTTTSQLGCYCGAATSKATYNLSNKGTWQLLTVSYNVTAIGLKEISICNLTFGGNATGTVYYTMPKLETGEIASLWSPSTDDVQALSFTLTNTSAKKKKFNVLFDGILSTSAQSYVLNAGASTAVSKNISGEFLACVRNPVFSIDDPDHTVTNSSLTITKPYLL